jgi:hypothetical protein
MLEPWRSQYLQALGVEVYRARYTLPAAAPSLDVEWDADALVPAEDEEPPIRDEIALAPSIATPAARHPSSKLPPVDIESTRNAKTVISPQPVATTAAPSLRIRLSIVASDSGVLIIDDTLPAARNEPQRLLGNLLFALQGRSVNLKLEPFEWPLPNLRNRQIELNEQAGRETLAGLLSRKIQGDVRTILLLGDNAQGWIDASLRETLATDRPLRWGLSVSALAVLNAPKLKQQWWQDLRPAITR